MRVPQRLLHPGITDVPLVVSSAVCKLARPLLNGARRSPIGLQARLSGVPFYSNVPETVRSNNSQHC